MKTRVQKVILFGGCALLIAAVIFGCVQLILPSLRFKAIQTRASVESLITDIDSLKGKLDHEVWSHYCELGTDEDLNTTLYDKLQKSKNADEFADYLSTAVEQAYWKGYVLHLSVNTDLGGNRGTISVKGDNVPKTAYGILTVFDSGSKVSDTLRIPVINGNGYYNLYGKNASKATLYLAADKEGKKVISATHTEEIYPLQLPELFISEISNQHTVTYYSDIENNNKQHRGSQEQKFQYVELHNYSKTDVDLSEYTFVYTDHLGEHKFEWLTEKNASMIIKPSETFVIGVYSADTALAGLRYESDTSIQEYWHAFNSFYGTEIPAGHRAMIACVASGDDSKMLDGVDHLERSADAGVTVTAEMRQGKRTVTKVSLPDKMPGNSYAYQFLPANFSEEEQAFLFTSGCFPGQLLAEQDLNFCEQPPQEDAETIKAVSFNILATDDNPAKNQGSVEYRSELFFRFMEEYKPDVIGLQEVNFRWTPLLSEKMKEMGYGEVQGISSENHTYADINQRNQWDLMNPIYYSLERYELLEGGDAFLTIDGTIDTAQWDSVNLKRTMTWAALKDKNSGEVITHINTHLILSGKAGRVEQVKAICAKGKELQKKYGGQIVVTGDHNMAEGSEPYQAYLSSGMLDSKYQTANHNSVSTFTDFDTAYNELYGAPIDFCFVSQGVAVSKYQVFGGRYSDGIISDHSAVLTELYLQK